MTDYASSMVFSPQVGDVVRGADIGKRKHSRRYVYAACAKCGAVRGWVEYASPGSRRAGTRQLCRPCGVEEAGRLKKGLAPWNKGLRGWLTDEHRQSRLLAITGRKHTATELTKMSKSQMGHRISDEAKRKLSQSRCRPWDYEELECLYLVDELSASEIARRSSCSVRAVTSALSRIGVRLRSMMEVRALLSGSKHPSYGRKRTGDKGNTGRYVRTEWHRQRASESSAGISPSTRLKLVAAQRTPEYRAAQSLRNSGEGNPNWQGGLSFEPYSPEFTEELKDSIRCRDGYSCRLCHTSQNGRKLDVHHIDRDKRNSDSTNLISLCHRCHIRTFDGGDYWESLFGSLLSFAGVL